MGWGYLQLERLKKKIWFMHTPPVTEVFLLYQLFPGNFGHFFLNCKCTDMVYINFNQASTLNLKRMDFPAKLSACPIRARSRMLLSHQKTGTPVNSCKYLIKYLCLLIILVKTVKNQYDLNGRNGIHPAALSIYSKTEA